MEKAEKELQERKKNVEEFSNGLKELSDEELDNVAGGSNPAICPDSKCKFDRMRNKCIC